MDASIATLAAAAIGGAIALVGLVANKENKISEFRQQWIDGLRQDIAALIGSMSVIQGGSANSEEALEKVNSLSARIHLRFKYEDDDSEHFRSALNDAGTLMLTSNTDDFKRAMTRLSAESQKMLRKEWLVVKRGEQVYRLLIGAISFGLIASFVVGIALVALHFLRRS